MPGETPNQSQPKPHSRTPSQQMAMTLRQKYGIERTPAQARKTLKTAIESMRSFLQQSGTYLPPWPYNAMQVIKLMNAEQYVFSLEDDDGDQFLSAWADGRDWTSKMGEL